MNLAIDLCDDSSAPDVMLQEALAAFAAGDWRAFASICKRLPENAASQRLLGLTRLLDGDAPGALLLLRPLAASMARDEELGIALAEAEWAAGSVIAALPYFRRVLSLAPARVLLRARFGEALLHAGLALREQGRMDDALAALREAVLLEPAAAAPRVALGEVLFATGCHDAAHAELREAVRLAPGLAVAWAKLGDMSRFTDTQEAVACYRAAVRLDPDRPELRDLLGNALHQTGQAAEGDAEFGRAMRARWRRTPPAGQLRVGILAAPGTGNTPTDYIIDRASHHAEPVFVLAGIDYRLTRIIERYDVLFNAISDPDAAPQALHLAGALAAQTGLPTVNPPQSIARTGRHDMAARLQGIDGLQVPLTSRHSRIGLLDALPQDAAPLLVRPVGLHGGDGIACVETTDGLRQALGRMTAQEVYLTPFVDFRSPDGLYRKLRVVFVGGSWFPVHLAIGEHWLSHYFRTRTAEDRALRAEEMAFLEQPERTLGARACLALAEISRRVELDFFGIDAALLQDGSLLLFECNATMLVRHTDRAAQLDYKRRPAERIRNAAGRLLRAKSIT